VPPYSNAVVGALLARETAIPLVTDFRDPWTRIDTVWVVRNRVLRWLSGLVERFVLRTSTAVIMADEIRYVDDFFVRTDAGTRAKVTSILNGFDNEDFPEDAATAPRPTSGKFVISYVGSFYDDATFHNVVKAFDGWQQAHPRELDDVEFHYAGTHSAMFGAIGFNPPYFRDHGYVSHGDAIAIRSVSSLQIFSQPPSFKPHVISGKIYEMMRVGVPILAITTPQGTVARFVERTRTGIVVDNRDPAAAARALREAYLAWKAKRPIAAPDAQAIAAFSRERQAAHLDRLLRSVCRGDDPDRSIASSKKPSAT
jgi:glycosyltransferase involved in cell wall biosynthesis